MRVDLKRDPRVGVAELRLRHSHGDSELRKQRPMQMPEHMPTHSWNLEPVACRINVSLEQIAVAEGFLSPCCKNQILRTSRPQVTPLAQRHQHDRTHWNLPLGLSGFYNRKRAAIATFHDPNNPVPQINPSPT